jgi:hypothetical protein
VAYTSTSLGYRLEITEHGAVLRKGAGHAELRFAGAQRPSIVPAMPTTGRFHFYQGPQAKPDNPMYAQVKQQDLYPGIDAVYYGSQSNVEYDLVVRPHADPGRIRFRFLHAKVDLQTDGSLQIEASGMQWQQQPPLAFQRISGQDRQVDARYSVTADGEISFTLGAYDPAVALTIDPILAPFGNVAAAGLNNGFLLSLDSQNNVYTAQVGTVNPGEGGDAIRIAKFSPSGTLLYQFQVQDAGGDDAIFVGSIAAAADGTLAAGGQTTSRDLPTTSNSFQRFKDVTVCPLFPLSVKVKCKNSFKEADGFVLKLQPNGSLQWATYLGAGDRDGVNSVAHGPNGTVYAAGETLSNFFPTKNQFQGCPTIPASAFLTVLRADGSDINYSTCLRPTFNADTRFSIGHAVTVDAAGMAYLVGQVATGNGEFPVRGAGGAAPFQPTPAGGKEAFAAKFNPAATGDASLLYSTLIGGSGDDLLDAVVLEPDGRICAAGRTKSSNYPLLAPPRTFTPLNPFRGPIDLTVTCLAANASTLTFSNQYGVELNDREVVGPTAPPRRWIARDTQGALHVSSITGGNFVEVNRFDNAGGSGTGVYLQLSPLARSVTTLSHTPEQAGMIATDSASVVFLGTNAGVRKFDLNCATDLTSLVQVVQGNIIFDVATGRFRQNVSLRSAIPAPVAAGARLVFTGLPNGVAVFQPAGTTTSCFAPVGAPFVTLPLIPPANSSFVTISVEFTSTGASVIYTPKIATPTGGV